MYTQDFESASQKRFQIQDTWTSLESFEVSGIASQSQQESFPISLKQSLSLLRSGFYSKLDIISDINFYAWVVTVGIFIMPNEAWWKVVIKKCQRTCHESPFDGKQLQFLSKPCLALNSKTAQNGQQENFIFKMERETGVLDQ